MSPEAKMKMLLGPMLTRLRCSPAEFCVYLETLFWTGMNWENYGEWCVSPIEDSADNDSFYRFTNFHPLWAKDIERAKTGR